MPFSPEMGSAVLSNRVDYVRVTDPVTARTAKADQGHDRRPTTTRASSRATWVNNKKKPFDDPRVRRAMHLALDRPVLVEVVKDVAPMQVGGFIYPFSEFATPKEELIKRLGYQEDPTAALKEAKALLAAAGHANGIKGLDLPGSRRRRPSSCGRRRSRRCCSRSASSANCARSSNRCGSTTPRTAISIWRSARSCRRCSTRPITSTPGTATDGPQNYSFWDNKEFKDLVDQIDREVDAQEAARADPPGRRDHGEGPAAACRSRGKRSTTSGTIT